MSHWTRGSALAAAAICLAVMLVGCQRSERQRTSLFGQAEHHFERGEYDAALDDYQAFLDRHPRSPLAETARLRIRSINREVQAMMDRKNMPEPTYTGASDKHNPPSPTADTSSHDAGRDELRPSEE